MGLNLVILIYFLYMVQKYKKLNKYHSCWSIVDSLPHWFIMSRWSVIFSSVRVKISFWGGNRSWFYVYPEHSRFPKISSKLVRIFRWKRQVDTHTDRQSYFRIYKSTKEYMYTYHTGFSKSMKTVKKLGESHLF